MVTAPSTSSKTLRDIFLLSIAVEVTLKNRLLLGSLAKCSTTLCSRICIDEKIEKFKIEKSSRR